MAGHGRQSASIYLAISRTRVARPQIIRNLLGAKLVASMAMFISRCSIQVLACLFLSSIQNCSILSLSGTYSMSSSTRRCKEPFWENKSGFSSIHLNRFSTADKPIASPNSRKARRYSAGYPSVSPFEKASIPSIAEFTTFSNRFEFLKPPYH